MKYLIEEAVVYVAGDYYNIIWNTTEKGLAWVEICGEKYYDADNGNIKSEEFVHKVKVPQLYGKTAKEVAELLTPLGLYLQPKGADSSAWHVVATAQDIDPDTEVERGTTVTVLFTDTNDMD